MKHVVFDLGQVLIAWRPEAAFQDAFADDGAIRDWMARIGFHDWNRRQDGGRSMADGLAAIRDVHGDEAAPLDRYAERFAATIAEPVPGSWQLAEALKARGHRLFAITNWSADHWPAARRVWPRLDGLFEDIVVSGIEGLLKPDPAIYLTLTGRNGIAPGDCVFIDDSAANVAGAQEVGMDAILFTDAPSLTAALAQRGIG